MALHLSENPTTSVPPGCNRILSLLSAQECNQLKPQLARVRLNLRDALFKADSPIEYCWFPISGMVSMMSDMENGDMAEVGVVGKEGYVGIPVVLGLTRADYQAVVQVPGEAYRIGVAEMRAAIAAMPHLMNILLLDTNAQLSVTAQCAACNALHTAEERLSRWLLMVRDRMSDDMLPITHEFLSMMLGTRRSTVTLVAGVLERAGLIEQSRGHIRIINATQLEKAACECYARIKRMEARVGP